MTMPDFAVVVLIGVSGSGQSTFARRHFIPSGILSSNAFQTFVSDDKNDQSATEDAFDALHYLTSVRLHWRKSVVIDATNVQPGARKPLLDHAARYDCLVVAIVLDVPESICHARNRDRADRQLGPHVIANQSQQLRQSLRGLLESVRQAVASAGLWEELKTDWLCLDCERMPSEKSWKRTGRDLYRGLQRQHDGLRPF